MNPDDYKQQLDQRAQAIAAQEAQVNAFNTTPQRTAQQLLTQTPANLLQLQEQQRQNELSKASALADIQTAKQEQEQYLKQFEQYQTAYNKQQDILQQQKDFEVAKRLYDRNIPPMQASGRIREYLKDMYTGDFNKTQVQQDFSEEVNKLQSQLPKGEKLIVDYNTMQIKGIDSDLFKASIPIQNYNKAITNYNFDVSTKPEERARLMSIPEPTFNDFIARQNNPVLDKGVKLLTFLNAPAIAAYDVYKKAESAFNAKTLEMNQKNLKSGNIFYSGVQDLNKTAVNKEWNPNIFQPVESGAYYLDKIASEGILKKSSEFEANNPFIGKIVKGTASSLIDPLVTFGLVSPVLSMEASSNFIETPYRVKPLAEKQAPRAEGLDIQVNPTKNEFMFQEEITIPRRYQYINTRLGEQFGLEPTKVTYAPEVRFMQRSTIPIGMNDLGQIKQPAIVEFQKIKPIDSEVTFLKLSGQSKLTPLSEAKPAQFSSVEARQFYDFFKTIDQAKTFRNYEPAVWLKNNQELFVSNLEVEKFLKSSGKITPETITLQIERIPKGRRIYRSTIIGKQEKLFSTSEMDVSGYRYTSRDTTFPTQVPRNFPKTKGVSYLPVPQGEESFITGGSETIVKTKPQVPRVDIIQKQISEVIQKALPEVKPIRPKAIETVKTATKTATAIIGSSSLVQSQQPAQKEQERTQQVPKESLMLSQVPRQEEVLRTSEATRALQVPRPAQTEIALPAEAQALRLRQQQREELVQRTVLRQANAPTMNPFINPRTRNPPSEGFFIFDDDSVKKKIAIKRIKRQALFIPEIRRRRKFISLSRPLPFMEAQQLAKRKALNTLGVTIRLRKQSGGFAPLSPDRFFKTSKTPFAIQQRTQRQGLKGGFLSSPFEVLEIQKSRRNKNIFF